MSAQMSELMKMNNEINVRTLCTGVYDKRANDKGAISRFLSDTSANASGSILHEQGRPGFWGIRYTGAFSIGYTVYCSLWLKYGYSVHHFL